MIRIGTINTLPVTRLCRYGALLDGGPLGEILLPNRVMPAECQPGDELSVFLFHDSEDRLTATTEKPRAQAGECAWLPIVEVNRVGAFADIGLAKHLLIPFSEQERPLRAGSHAAVHLFIDGETQRLTGSTRLRDFLNETGAGLWPGQEVSLLVCQRTDIGYKAVINHSHLGMLLNAELDRPVRPGTRTPSYVRRIRSDGRIDLSLARPGLAGIDELAEKVARDLAESGGVSALTDKAPPDAIRSRYGCSKANYKKALGRLLKAGRIRLDSNRVELVLSAKRSTR